jgi:acyl carrier protein phosphodiesterase
MIHINMDQSPDYMAGCLKDYQNLNHINESKQNMLHDIKNISMDLDKAENVLLEKISLRRDELDALKKDFNNITDQYNHIIRSFVKK